MMVESTRTITNDDAKYLNNANEATKQENNGKVGYKAQAQ